MKLDVNGGLVIDSIDQVSLIDTLEVHLRPTGGYAILSKSDVTYIYTEGSPEAGYQLEYQEGSLANHFQSVKSDLDFDNIINAFSQYLMGDKQWKYGIHWDRLVITNNETYDRLKDLEPIEEHKRPQQDAVPSLNSIVYELQQLRRWWLGLGLGIIILLINGKFLEAIIFSIILSLPIIWKSRKVPVVFLLDRYGVKIKGEITEVWCDGGHFVACKYIYDRGVVQRISHSEYLHMEVGEEVLIRYLPKIPGIARVENLSSR